MPTIYSEKIDLMRLTPKGLEALARMEASL